MKGYEKVRDEGGPYDTLIQAAADAHGVNYALLHKQLFMESSFNPTAQSPTGPRGLGQFTRATGKAYGLISDEDFFSPEKSIDAAARHMKDNVHSAGGDELKALLMYNQGAGRLGSPQLAAYDAGDFSGISEEGRNYMDKMRDVVTTGKQNELEAFVKPGGSYEAPTGLDAAPQAQRLDPSEFSRASMSFTGEDLQPTNKPFGQDLYEATGSAEEPKQGLFDGLGEAAESGIQNSPLGVALRAASASDESDFSQTFRMMRDVFNDPLDRGRVTNWEEEDFEALRRSGLSPQFFDVVLRGDKRDFQNNLKLAKENQELDGQFMQAGVGAQLLGGAAEMVGDPYTLLGPGKAQGGKLIARLASGAVAGGAVSGLSESNSAAVSGREENIGMAIAGGAVFGGVLNSLLGKRQSLDDVSWSAPKGNTGDLRDWNSNSQSGYREDVSDADLERILERHGEGGLKNSEVDLLDGMEPVPRDPLDGDTAEMDRILARYERGPIEEEGSNTSMEDILSRMGDSAEPNEFYGATTRLEAREAARLSGSNEDPTRMPYRDGEEILEDGIVPYLDAPFEEGAVRTLDGSIHSGGSVLNPKTVAEFAALEVEFPKAYPGVQMGSISEVGLKLLRSDNEGIRRIGADLFRSPTGMTDGSGGKFGATASDIVERLKATDNITHNEIYGHIQDVLDDPFWKAQQGTQNAKREYISRRVVEALEDTSGTPHKLTPEEKALMETVRTHMADKWSMVENPGQFGHPDAVSLLGFSRHEGSYFPQRYNLHAKAAATQKLGGPEQLQSAIKRSWLASYSKRPSVKARVDRLLKAEVDAEVKRLTAKLKKGVKPDPTMPGRLLRSAVEKYANDKAYGVSHSDQFSGSTHMEENLLDGADLGANSYLEARNLFDSDVRIDLPDGTDFSVNDLREFDMLRVVPQYDRRVNGDIGIMGGTGKTTGELKAQVDKIRASAPKGAEQIEAEALMDGLKLLTGRTRRDPDNAFETGIRVLSDVGFMTKNAYMGVQNLTEAAALIVKGHQRMLLKNIPILKQWTTKGTKLKPEDIKKMHGAIFGRELDDLIRPQRADIVERLREQNSSRMVAETMGSVKWATGELSVRSPFTYLLRETSNFLVDAGRQGALIDLADFTLNGKATDLFSEGRLRSAAVSPEQFANIQALIRENFSMDAKGKWSLKDAASLAADPRSMDLWRLGDTVADETVLRPHKMSNQASSQYGATMGLALQFKMFVLRSLNGRMVRGWMEATKNKQALDQQMAVLVSMGLATAFHAARSQVAAYGLPERKREEYLERSLQPSMLAYAAISRSSHIGAPLSVFNFIAAPMGLDAAARVRTSVLPREPIEKRSGLPMKFNALSSTPTQDFLSRTAEQLPGAQVLASVGQAGYSAKHLLGGERGMDAQGHRTALWNALRQFVPNDPVSQNLMMRLAEDQGVDRAR
jgi:hypothetical protein